MADIPSRDRDNPWAILAAPPLAKSSHQDEPYHTFGPYLCNLRRDNSNDSVGTRRIRYTTPPRSVPSLCEDSTPSPNSTTCTLSPRGYSLSSTISQRLYDLMDLSQDPCNGQSKCNLRSPVERQMKSPFKARRSSPGGVRDRKEQHPIASRADMNLDENSQSYDEIGSIIRWLGDTTTHATIDKFADSKETEDVIAYDIDSPEDGARGVPGRDAIAASLAVSKWISSDNISQETGCGTTCIDDSTDLAVTQTLIEFHHRAVSELLQEFRQWQAHRNHTSGTDFNGSASVSGSSAVVNTGNETPSNGIPRTNQGSSTRGRKRRSDDDDEGPPSSKRNKNDTPDEVGSRRTLACPFVKRDPVRYRKCFGYTKLWNTSRVK
jgi:hypothetical protein